MNIKCVKMNKKYIRKIEGMSKGLLLFKVGAEIKQSGQNFHLLYEDKRKPPLDIAINPNNGTIEYITYFIQDEKILSEKLQAYKIDNMNYLLFSQSQFCGIVFKNILSEEWDEIINSQCI